MAARSPRPRPSAASHDTARDARSADRTGVVAGQDVPASLLGRLGRGRTLVMGVVNVTPDSFHEQSRAADRDLAVAAAERQAAAGADLLDVGGESTRPGASP